MKTFWNDIQLKEIALNSIVFSKDYLLIFNSEPTPPYPIFFFDGYNNYPVFYFFNKNEFEQCQFIKAIVFENKNALLEFVLSIKGVANLRFVDKLLMLNFLKDSNDAKFFDEDNLSKYLPILNLPDVVLTQLNENKMSPDLALKLLDLNQDEIIQFANFTIVYKLSISLQKEVFDYLITEIKVNKKSFKEILSEITNDSGPSTKVDILYKIRKSLMPEYTKTLEIYNTLKNSLSLPKKIHLVETPYFETKTMKIEIFFKNLDELKKCVQDLNINLEKKKDVWEQIFNVI